MVAYGAWRDSPEFVETHRPRVNGDGPYLMYDEGQPYARSGWEFLGTSLSSVRDGSASTQQYLDGEGGPVANPDFGTAGISGQAWNNMIEDLYLFSPGSLPISLNYMGSINPIEDGGPGSQIERWIETDWRSVLGYAGGMGTDWATVLAGPAEEWPEGAIGVDFELTDGDHLNDYVQILEATVEPWTATGAASWALIIKDAGNPLESDGPFLVNVSDPFALNVAAMGQVMEVHETTPGITYEMPFFTITWDGGWPGDYGGPDHLRTLGAVVLEVVIRYTGPRWRFIYDGSVDAPVAYRRIFPRDDGLAGGAPRTFPPSKAAQSSNRTSGGYL